ncbi:hypothetical protein SNEBB_002358 [Seison nebaliae]|nr:hypothetical protein SNEBB_002358 [Seison nebaliae]
MNKEQRRDNFNRTLLSTTTDRLICLVPYWKDNNFKATKVSRYLGLSISTVDEHKAKIILFREEKDKVAEIKTIYNVSDVVGVDVHSNDANFLDIELKPQQLTRNDHRFYCLRTDKNEYVYRLHTVICRNYVKESVKFSNWDVEENSKMLSIDKSKGTTNDDNYESNKKSELEEFSEMDLMDLEKYIFDANIFSGKMGTFLHNLNNKVNELETENIEDILNSEQTVNRLLKSIDAAIGETNEIDNKLELYEDKLSSISDSIKMIGEKNSTKLVSLENRKKLDNELTTITNNFFTFPEEMSQLLGSSEEMTLKNMKDLVNISNILNERFIQYHSFSSELKNMRSINEGYENYIRLEKLLSLKIEQCLNNFLNSTTNAIFYQLDKSRSLVLANSEFEKQSLKKLEWIHQFNENDDIKLSSILIKWLRKNFKNIFEKFIKAYSNKMQDVYDRLLSSYMKVFKTLLEDLGSDGPDSNRPSRASVSSDRQKDLNFYLTRLNMFNGRYESGIISKENRILFTDFFADIMSALLLSFKAEVNFFLNYFFGVSTETLKNRAKDAIANNPGNIDNISQCHYDYLHDDENKLMKNNLQIIFKGFPSRLHLVPSQVESIDRIGPIHIYAVLNQVVQREEAHITKTIMSQTLGNLMVVNKREMDLIFHEGINTIMNTKYKKDEKIGALSWVTDLSQFFLLAEDIKHTRRSDLDKLYKELVMNVMNRIEYIAQQCIKTPPDVVRFTNYRILSDILSKTKIGALAEEKQRAKMEYGKSQITYIKAHYGRPFHELSDYFATIESVLASGTKVSDLSFRPAYSVTNIKHNIASFTMKHMTKTIDDWYHLLRKHFSEPADRTVLWYKINKEVLDKYKRYDGILKEAYPIQKASTEVQFEFSATDIVKCFNSIGAKYEKNI